MSALPPDESEPALAPADLDELEDRIDTWLHERLVEESVVDAVDRGEPGQRRWYVRMRGEDKDFITVWFTLRQRSLHFECHVIPAPEENHEAFYEYFLRRNAKLFGMAFAIGVEDAVFLVGAVPATRVDERALDRVIGSAYAYVEQSFRPALHIGYASRFRRSS